MIDETNRPPPRATGACLAAVLLCVLGTMFTNRQAAAQEARVDTAAAHPDSARGQALRVFLDCETFFCDDDFFRREILFVNYTRDRADAQVHVLITSEDTGGGGERITVDFLGRQEFEGMDDRLETTTGADISEEQLLSQVTRTIRLGLLRYVARTPAAEQIEIVYEGEAAGEGAVVTAEDDPWNFWVFRASLDGEIEVEEREETYELSAGLSANRITEDLKLQFVVSGRYEEQNFDIDSTRTITSVSRNYDAGGAALWSLTNHWSAGFLGSATHSSFSNEELAVRVAAAGEYNLFPYAESTRRQLVFRYSLGITYNDYIEETIFEETAEGLPDHRFLVALDVRQPWGSSSAALEAVQILSDPSKHRIVLFGGLEIRLLRGLSLEIDGSASRVRDQVNLPRGDATEEEILTRQRELQTDFEYSLSLGLSYTFGSIFS
ncbi:MAG: hypothetical protein ACRELC_08245, partial [Gemmatimonadota bacterium]